MKKYWLIAAVPGDIAIGIGVVVPALFLVKVLWAWTMPDLFPGAVEQWLVAGEISCLTAFKIAIFVGFIGAISGLRGNGEKK